MPYLAVYPLLFYVARGEALPAVSFSFMIAIVLAGFIVKKHITRGVDKTATLWAEKKQ